MVYLPSCLFSVDVPSNSDWTLPNARLGFVGLSGHLSSFSAGHDHPIHQAWESRVHKPSINLKLGDGFNDGVIWQTLH